MGVTWITSGVQIGEQKKHISHIAHPNGCIPAPCFDAIGTLQNSTFPTGEAQPAIHSEPFSPRFPRADRVLRTSAAGPPRWCGPPWPPPRGPCTRCLASQRFAWARSTEIGGPKVDFKGNQKENHHVLFGVPLFIVFLGEGGDPMFDEHCK